MQSDIYLFKRIAAGLIVVLICSQISIASDPQSPDPLVLLRGVEQSRLGVKSGRLELQMSTRQDATDPDPARVSIEFNRDRRTIIDKRSATMISSEMRNEYESRFKDGGKTYATDLGTKTRMETRSAWDGSQLCQFSKGSRDADYRNLSGGVPDYAFDPRVIGLSHVYGYSATIRSTLRLDVVKEIQPARKDFVNGVPVWHVSVLDIYDAQSEYWIQDAQAFRVHRVKYTPPNGFPIGSIESIFPSDPSAVLPSQVIVKATSKSSQTTRYVKATVENAQFNIDVNPNVGTLASLDLPIGTRVNDNRTSKRLGYWNGSGLSPESITLSSPTETESAAPDGGPRRDRWLLYIFGGVVAIAAGAIVYRFTRRRDLTAKISDRHPADHPKAGE